MAKRIPPEVLEYMRKMGKAYGSQGGKTAAKNMTAEERKARARKASLAAAKKRTAARLARERAERAKRSPKQ
jgi:7-keto-8-aminopelargonate synthetase-like enzyme